MIPERCGRRGYAAWRRLGSQCFEVATHLQGARPNVQSARQPPRRQSPSCLLRPEDVRDDQYRGNRALVLDPVRHALAGRVEGVVRALFLEPARAELGERPLHKIGDIGLVVVTVDCGETTRLDLELADAQPPTFHVSRPWSEIEGKRVADLDPFALLWRHALADDRAHAESQCDA